MKRRTALGLLSSAVVPAAAQDHGGRALRLCRQLLRVSSPEWDSTAGSLTLWQRDRAGAPWQRDGRQIPVILGRGGMRWGLGLHAVPEGAARKQEGDGCSPAGLFELDTGFGPEPAGPEGAERWPWQQMTATHAGVDDPASRHYNRIVNAAAVRRDWSSAENMVPASGAYRLGLVVRHNWKQKPGAGSCIFLHTGRALRQPTSGCTAMSGAALQRILSWLDPDLQPLLAQLPRAAWELCGPAWGLPAAAA